MSGNTLLDYARHHGLAIDHQSYLSTFKLEALFRRDITTCHDTAVHLQDVQEALACSNSKISEILTESRLKLTINESVLLSSATARPVLDGPSLDSVWECHLPNHRLKRELKCQEPLVFANGGDVCKDLQGVKEGIDLDLVLQDVRDQWKVDKRDDYEKMRFDDDKLAHELSDANDRIRNEIKNGKMQARREVIRLLGEIVKCEDMGDHMPTLYLEQLRHGRRKRLIKLPVILSVYDFEDMMNGEHSAEDNEISGKDKLADSDGPKLESEDSIHEVDRLAALTRAVHADDQLTQGDQYDQEQNDIAIGVFSPKTKQRYTDISGDPHTTTLEPARKRRKVAQDIKTLMPPSIYSSPKDKHISTEHNSCGDFEIASGIETLLESKKYGDEEFILTQDTATSFDQELIKLSDEAVAGIDNKIVSESTNSVSALSKLEVSDLLYSRLRSSLQYTRREHLIDQFLDNKIQIFSFDQEQESALNWVPFAIPRLEETKEEVLPDASNYLSKVIVRPEKVTRSEQLLWKEAGLRILRDMELDEAEFELASESDDFVSIDDNVTKDDRTFDSGASRRSSSLRTNYHTHVSTQASALANKPPRNQKVNINPLPQSVAATSMRHLLLDAKLPCEDESGFSASKSLSSFLDLRGRKFIKPKNVVTHIARESSEDPIQLTQESTSLVTRDWSEHAANGRRDPSDCNKIPPSTPDLFLPPMAHLDGTRTIIVNNALLQSHPTLIPYLEQQGGSDLSIIYRDFDPKYENCPDFVLDPKTAVMYTNTQLLAQRPLPGQNKLGEVSPVHQSTSKLAASFENVIVMIMHNCSIVDKLNCADSVLVSKFIAYCDLLSSSDSRVRVLWLRYSRTTPVDKLINAWTWSCIAQYGLSSPSLLGSSQLVVSHDAFIQDETLWELFLRRAGMNTLAAQFVLGALKKSESHLRDPVDTLGNENNTQSWGLSRFVSMRSEERLQLFADFLGRKSISLINDSIECHSEGPYTRVDKDNPCPENVFQM